MGYSGTPMTSVRNNKMLLRKRTKLFELEGFALKAESGTTFNVSKYQVQSEYEKEQRLERRTHLMLRIRKEQILFASVVIGLLLILIFFITKTLL